MQSLQWPRCKPNSSFHSPLALSPSRPHRRTTTSYILPPLASSTAWTTPPTWLSSLGIWVAHPVSASCGASSGGLSCSCTGQSAQPISALVLIGPNSFGASFPTFYRLVGPYKSELAPGIVKTELWETIHRRGLAGNIFMGVIPMVGPKHSYTTEKLRR